MKVSEHDQPTEYGGGENGKVHTLLLHDMHGEYTGGFDERLKGFGYGEVDLYWQTSKMQDALQEIFDYKADIAERQTTSLMREMLPAAFLEREGDYIEWVWRVTGCKEYLVAKFDQLCKALTVDQVSGDDDAFDYWPNTMDMLWDFATDLDDIGVVGSCRARVWEIAKKVFQGTVNARDARPDYHELFVQEWGLDYEDRSNEGWRDWYINETRGQR